MVSVVIPVYNNGGILLKCLGGVCDLKHENFEVIVVDDCSTENIITNDLAGAHMVKLQTRSGPAAARNIGAQRAIGDILLFIDSDVLISADTIKKVSDFFSKNIDVSAMFGSYDDEPSEKNFFSQYRNLFHHFHHQTANTRATTFWAGCGAIKKDVFREIGGFDQLRYKIPAIEDIELGYRLIDKGHTIELKKDLLVKHMKHWDFLSILRTDIFQRAVPWSRLILETRSIARDLNLKVPHRISSFLVLCIVVLAPLSFMLKDWRFVKEGLGSYPGASILLSIITIVLLNLPLYTFFCRKRGLLFALATVPLHFLYYFYSGAAFAVCWILYKTGILKGSGGLNR
ncbi:MAG: glycosyltransferase family 2 protein [Nitrospirae bacterium]|nr:glycosyltransferase family 2 protein [Nitrospirota bacterium]